MNETTELTIGLETTDYEFDFDETGADDAFEAFDTLNQSVTETETEAESVGTQVAESVASEQLAQAIETVTQEAVRETQQPPAEAAPSTTEEKESPKPVEEKATQDQPTETVAPKSPQDEIQALLNELKQRLAESELMEYARQQGRLIDVEIKKLNAAGVRVTEAEVRNVVQEAMQKGIEPVVYFKAYAADLLQNMLIFGEPLLSKPPVSGSETASRQAVRINRPTLEERFRTKEGLVGIDYFVAEEIAGAFDDYE